MSPEVSIDGWLKSLESRHLGELSFQEVRRALQALSTDYVQRRHRLNQDVLAGRGKRAAFAYYYGPLHFLLIQHIVQALPRPKSLNQIVDLGCGTGVAGAAWALTLPQKNPLKLTAIDRNPWTLQEARHTLDYFQLKGTIQRGDIAKTKLPGGPCGVVAAFTVNELIEADRQRLLERLKTSISQGACWLIIEPIAKSPTPWWPTWRQVFESLGGRHDEWRFPVQLPEPLARMAKAAKLRDTVLKARSLYLFHRDAT